MLKWLKKEAGTLRRGSGHSRLEQENSSSPLVALSSLPHNTAMLGGPTQRPKAGALPLQYRLLLGVGGP